MHNYSFVMTDEGAVRVGPVEARILQNSYGPQRHRFPPTPKAAAIMAACQRVAEWRKQHDA